MKTVNMHHFVSSQVKASLNKCLNVFITNPKPGFYENCKNESFFIISGFGIKCHETLEEPSDETLVECDEIFDSCGKLTQEGIITN